MRWRPMAHHDGAIWRWAMAANGALWRPDGATRRPSMVVHDGAIGAMRWRPMARQARPYRSFQARSSMFGRSDAYHLDEFLMRRLMAFDLELCELFFMFARGSPREADSGHFPPFSPLSATLPNPLI